MMSFILWVAHPFVPISCVVRREIVLVPLGDVLLWINSMDAKLDGHD